MGSRIALAHSAVVAGALAALVTSVLIWAVSQSGILTLVNVPLDQPLTSSWIYKRMVWGGIWSLLFLLPWFSGRPQRQRGMIWGLVPSAATLLFFNPFWDRLGILGLAWGWGWPVVVILFNVLWGYLAGVWLDTIAARSKAAPAES